MKKLFKNLIKTTFAVSLMFFGAVFVDAAGQFINYDPMGGTVTSISETNFNNRSNTLKVSIPNPGDSKTFKVYSAYQNINPSRVIYTATGKFHFQTTGSSYSTTIKGILTGSANEFMQDDAILNGLPNSWEIELYEARKVNNHPVSISPNCIGNGAPYQYDVSLDLSEVTGSGSQIDDLDYIGKNPNTNVTGVCDQGYLIGFFRVTNTESNNTVDLQTNEATNIMETSVTLHGEVASGNNTNVWFVKTTNSNPSNLNCNYSSQRVDVSGYYNSGDSFSVQDSGLNPGTKYYYKACAAGDSNSNRIEFTTDSLVNSIEVQTNNASGIGDTSAQLRGNLVSGNNVDTWFVMKENTDYLLNCATPEQKEDVSGYYNSGDSFSKYVSGLNSNTTYYYKACANDGHIIDYQSNVLSFHTNGNDVNTVLPNVETRYANDVDDSSADIHGYVDMNDYNNGFVFYVYGKDESAISNIETLYDSYSDVNENGEDLQKSEVDGDLDSSNSYSESITNLDSDEYYYYNFCVGYVDTEGQDKLECGSSENFKTLDNGNSNTNSEIETRNVDNITKSSAEICGDLVNDGGDVNLRTWIEYRKITESSYSRTNKIDRGEGYFCENVRNLSSNTRYYYRACSDDGCDTSSSFRTSDGVVSGDNPAVTTGIAYSIGSNYAILPSSYVTNADKATVWFQYGYTPTYLNKNTKHYVKYGAGGSYVHYFTNLKSNQRYCYRAMIETVNGSDHGSVNCFYTKVGSQVVVEVPDDTVDETDQLGLGLSLVKLEINDNKEKVIKNENITYRITWENISDLDLEDLDLVIEIPREIQITSSSRGQMDTDRNAIVYTIRNLDSKEENSMTVTGVVKDGKLGDALTADATLGFNNPVNEAKENATDYDIDEFTILTPLGTASVFGLSNITFLGWLTILLGLLIVFLVARWLYLEREDLRAQAYVNGYRRSPSRMEPMNNHDMPMHNQHNDVRNVHQERPVQNTPQNGDRSDYRPYRPNRG